MISENKQEKAPLPDQHTPLVCLFFILIAAIVYWDSTGYSDADSYVFPRAVAIIMTALSIALIVQWLLVRPPQPAMNAGNNFRRIGLVAVMLAAALLMPWLGFLVTGVILFLALIFLSMYDPWTPKRLFYYPLCGVGLVFGFYYIFKQVLLVPLPVGVLFGG